MKNIRDYLQYPPQVLTCKEIKAGNDKPEIKNAIAPLESLLWIPEVNATALSSTNIPQITLVCVSKFDFSTLLSITTS